MDNAMLVRLIAGVLFVAVFAGIVMRRKKTV